ncbi:hypothetical protein M0R45_026068 [Rubus argutus]|uniref:Uncharacterized protein n=1 Tax=Rubus argutus TaxID=59490 RepID=A0AAW1WXV7_RUBAR
MKLRKEAMMLEDRAMRTTEREERIMEMNTSGMSPIRMKFWQRKQKKIAEKYDNEDDDDTIGVSNRQPPTTDGSTM